MLLLFNADPDPDPDCPPDCCRCGSGLPNGLLLLPKAGREVDIVKRDYCSD